tara:strand:+ start:5965 stop:8985 length:3021 start_codon:yes stop_codon:yes gene_type:complete
MLPDLSRLVLQTGVGEGTNDGSQEQEPVETSDRSINSSSSHEADDVAQLFTKFDLATDYSQSLDSILQDRLGFKLWWYAQLDQTLVNIEQWLIGDRDVLRLWDDALGQMVYVTKFLKVEIPNGDLLFYEGKWAASRDALINIYIILYFVNIFKFSTVAGIDENLAILFQQSGFLLAVAEIIKGDHLQPVGRVALRAMRIFTQHANSFISTKTSVKAYQTNVFTLSTKAHWILPKLKFILQDDLVKVKHHAQELPFWVDRNERLKNAPGFVKDPVAPWFVSNDAIRVLKAMIHPSFKVVRKTTEMDEVKGIGWPRGIVSESIGGLLEKQVVKWVVTLLEEIIRTRSDEPYSLQCAKEILKSMRVPGTATSQLELENEFQWPEDNNVDHLKWLFVELMRLEVLHTSDPETTVKRARFLMSEIKKSENNFDVLLGNRLNAPTEDFWKLLEWPIAQNASLVGSDQEAIKVLTEFATTKFAKTTFDHTQWWRTDFAKRVAVICLYCLSFQKQGLEEMVKENTLTHLYDYYVRGLAAQLQNEWLYNPEETILLHNLRKCVIQLILQLVKPRSVHSKLFLNQINPVLKDMVAQLGTVINSGETVVGYAEPIVMHRRNFWPFCEIIGLACIGRLTTTHKDKFNPNESWTDLNVNEIEENEMRNNILLGTNADVVRKYMSVFKWTANTHPAFLARVRDPKKREELTACVVQGFNVFMVAVGNIAHDNTNKNFWNELLNLPSQEKSIFHNVINFVKSKVTTTDGNPTTTTTRSLTTFMCFLENEEACRIFAGGYTNAITTRDDRLKLLQIYRDLVSEEKFIYGHALKALLSNGEMWDEMSTFVGRANTLGQERKSLIPFLKSQEVLYKAATQYTYPSGVAALMIIAAMTAGVKDVLSFVPMSDADENALTNIRAQYYPVVKKLKEVHKSNALVGDFIGMQIGVLEALLYRTAIPTLAENWKKRKASRTDAVAEFVCDLQSSREALSAAALLARPGNVDVSHSLSRRERIRSGHAGL